jgi:hypothetical protein
MSNAPELERNVGIDPQTKLYIIKHAEGMSTLGWYVCKDRTERMALNLGMTDFTAPATGTREAYDMMLTLQEALKLKFERTGEKACYDLSPQLLGIEGHRVEVVDHEGEAPRRFIVGKSTGWAPCHLEIKTTRSTGGHPARLEYHSVKDLGMTSR